MMNDKEEKQNVVEFSNGMSVIIPDLKYISTITAGEVLGVSRKWTYQLMVKGKIKCRRVGKNLYTTVKDLTEYVNSITSK
jgi:hypothetical protein